MKNFQYLFAATLIVATASCSKELDQELLPEGGIAIKATIENIDTRAAINGTKVTWSAGDQIGILLNNGKYATLTLKTGDAGKATGTFAGVLIGDVEIASDAHAFYPADICKDPNNVELPSSYNIGSDFANSHAYMRADVDGGNLSFTHLGGVVKLVLKGVPSNSAQIVYTTLDNKNIVGEFALAEVDGKTQISTSAGSGEESSLTVNFDALQDKSDLTISLPMPVGEYRGVKLEIKDINGKNTVEPVSFANATVNVSRANLLSMPTLKFVEFTTVSDAWDGETYTEVEPTSETIGNVTYNKVYDVSNPAEFAWTAKNVALDDPGVYIRLNSNVDLGEKDFEPYGNIARDENSGFAGVIDGGGNTISGLKTSATGKNNGVGLVAVAKDATIKNLNIDGANLSSEDFAGAVVGCALGKVTLSDCHVTNSVITSNDKSGGIMGRAYGTNVTITNCTVDESVTVQGGSNAGGVVAIVNCTTSITGCTNYAKIEGAGNAGYGGIIGYMAGGKVCTIDDCTNNGKIGTTDSSYSGGVCGYINGIPENLTIQNSTNTAAVYGNIVGGIFGGSGQYGPITVTGCSNSGNIQGKLFAGGIAGASGGGSSNWSHFTNCTNTGNVTAKYAGGVFGQIQYAEVTNCSGGGNTAVITCTSDGYKGRITGDITNGPSTSNAILTINDDNGDDYTNIGTIGAMAVVTTSWGTVKIASGTLRGAPYCGMNTCVITIVEGASWTDYPDQTGTWQCTAGSSTWTKVS